MPDLATFDGVLRNKRDVTLGRSSARSAESIGVDPEDGGR